MSARRALLIGASEYGQGFAPLPAVAADLEIVDRALTALGYEVAVLSADATQSATDLINAIEEFGARCQRNDVHVIYFSGHGMLLGNDDCLVPAGADLGRVLRRSDLRVPTDVSASLPPDHGLVVFFIDACRSTDHQPTTKGAALWGDDSRIKAPADHRFVRFFGCSSGQVCHVLESGHEGRPVSVFSKALANVLAAGQATTLKECLTHVQLQCQQLADVAHLELQTPRLSVGEISADSDQVLGAPMFEPAAAAAVPSIWEAFDPGKLHCLVIGSEHEATNPPALTLDDLVAAALTDTGRSEDEPEHTAADSNPRIWDAFCACSNGAELVSGKTRTISQQFSPSLVRRATVPISRALASPAALRETVRGVIEADLVIFDVTGFEPGVMLLVGVRMACRRGVTLCSHGNRWREGQPLDLPFNLQDLNVGSHTPREAATGVNPVVKRFVERAVAGFRQLQRGPHYLDLPAYDALRQLGSEMAASALIPTSRRVLVLCPYEKAFFTNWELLAFRLSSALSDGHNIRPQITRVIDLATPQLVSQSIYEQARRTAACVVDWSAYSPSVFVEFGVRQTVSEWGAVSIVDPQFANVSEDKLSKFRAALGQIPQLRKLFQPIDYSLQDQQQADVVSIAAALVNRNPHVGANQDLSIIHDAAWRAVGVVQRVLPTVFAELGAAADALSHADRGQVEAPQILFYESSALKLNSEDAAAERRIAAWLYLHKRLNAGELPEDDPRRQSYLKLGEAAAAALYAQSDRGRVESLDLAFYVEDEMNRSRASAPGRVGGTGSPFDDARTLQQQATLDRKRGDALRRARREPEARQAFDAGIAKLERTLHMLESGRSLDARLFAERAAGNYGSLAGLLRRVDRADEAYRNYVKGAAIEQEFTLPTTYNRVNEIKYALLTGQATIAEVEARARTTADQLAAALSNPATQQLGDDGWAWADLGDCRGLTGALTEAIRAYATFKDKAGVQAPVTTLEVLQNIADTLVQRQDPNLDRVTNTMAALRSLVSAGPRGTR